MIKRVALALLALPLANASALASDASDVAREMRLPVAVVEDAFANVDAYANSPEGPANRLATGVLKELALKAFKNRLGNLDDSGPGKGSDASAEERNAVYKANVRTTRRDATEASECAENKVTVSSSEALPVVKDGSFTFDAAHPRITSRSWTATFCRARTAGGDFGEWKLTK
ncbi:MAG TPA: hypothetical protein VL974_09025 [Magnetospirillum sp.]|nr:hypothetical protein [Magnetospirillum sp.]